MRKAGWLVASLLVSCGSDGLDKGFNGFWNQTMTITVSGAAPAQYSNILQIESDTHKAVLSGICPVEGEGGASTTNGSGKTLYWESSSLCGTVQFGSCSTMQFTMKTGTLTLEDGTMTGSGTATGIGCGPAVDATYTVQETKQ